MRRIFLGLALFEAIPAFAQPGIDEMRQASQQLRLDYFSAFDCSIVLAAVLGITGAVRIYYSLQLGKKDITAEITAWFLAAIFMVLAGAFLTALFGI